VTAVTALGREQATLTRLEDEDVERLLLIRRFEEALLDLFAAGLLSGTTHTCIGQEHIPVALSALLDEGDFVFSNHRGHGHYLARFGDPQGLLAEIMGREGAVCNGVGGSQHILRDRYLSTGIQGESLPVAAGAALRLKRREPGRLALAYVGDGTWGEGAVYEALNLAALWALPLLVVVEHNGIAQSTPTARQLAGTIGGRARAFGVGHVLVDSLDVNVIRRKVAPHVAAVRDGAGPLVAELRTHRVGPHSKGDDTRPPEAIAHAREHDWLPHYAAAFPDQFETIDDRQRLRVAAVVEDVVCRPPSRWEPLCRTTSA
jgi:TPP-dependent pyruvate/acetoin dehydrogenase alpha subunit